MLTPLPDYPVNPCSSTVWRDAAYATVVEAKVGAFADMVPVKGRFHRTSLRGDCRNA